MKWRCESNLKNYLYNKYHKLWSDRMEAREAARYSSQLPGWVESIERFLTLEDTKMDRQYADLTEELKKCYGRWREMLRLRPQNEAAKAVIGGWSKAGGIRDLLEEQRNFAGEAAHIPPEIDACALSYSSHMFHLRSGMTDLTNLYQKRSSTPAAIPEGADGVAQFILDECRDVAAICDLPEALYDGRRLLEELESEKPMSAAMKRRCLAVLGAWDLLRSYSESTISELEAIRANIDARIQAMENNIAKGVPLYKRLTGTLTDEWFQAFDPASPLCELRGASADQVGAFYKERIEALPDFLPEQDG